MPHIIRFRDRSALYNAYADLNEQVWVAGCCVDLANLSLSVQHDPRHQERATSWLEQARQLGDAHDPD